jgi:hypothetical protein
MTRAKSRKTASGADPTKHDRSLVARTYPASSGNGCARLCRAEDGAWRLTLIAQAQDIRDDVCCFLGIENELRHARMGISQPDVQPDRRGPGSVRDHPKIRSIGKADWRSLIRRDDVARSASPHREVMTRLRIARIWQPSDVCGVRRRQLGARWNARRRTDSLFHRMLARRERRGAAAAHCIDVLSYCPLRSSRGIAGFAGAGT